MTEEFDPFYFEQTFKSKKRDFKIALLVLTIVVLAFLIVSFFKGIASPSKSYPLYDETLDQIEKIFERSGGK